VRLSQQTWFACRIKENEMDTSDEKPVPCTNEGLRVELGRLEWAKGLSQETLTVITSTAEYVEFHAGEVVIEVESEITHAWFLITGRLQATLYDLLGKEIQKDTFVRGSVVGLFSLGLSDRSHLHVEATEPSTAIRLTLSDLLQLSAKHADFQLTMFRLAANIFKRYVTVDRSLPKPSVVGIVHHTEASRPLLSRLARRLQDLDESPCIASDDKRWKPDRDIAFRLLVGDGRVEERPNILKDWASHRRLLVDVGADHSPEAMARFLSYVDIVLWCVRPEDASATVNRLQGLEKSVPRWRDKLRIVWLLGSSTRIAPYVPELHELADRDFKLTLEPPGANQSSLLQHGFERIVHHLRGIQIGLALGGGAARGMAHLGVLKALEQHGIYVDMLAGTSAGAMTGTIYAAGLNPEHVTQFFKTDLQPSWFFRQLPGGGYWYLLYKYRRRHFDSMLRKYLGRSSMQQLILPMFTIAVDLVEGEPVVREAGDAIRNILESINLPPLSLPILGSGQALVDGGLLNNIPANVLVAKGCNFVIASSVTAKLEKDFLGIRSKGRSPSRRVCSTIQVIMRQNMIQDYNMNAVGVQPADFVIAPDVTSFDISEFTRADEMARIGEATTNATVADLRKMLSKLDSKLFESSSTNEGGINSNRRDELRLHSPSEPAA
jgi:predicted acylesterase/phospholipase RssA/CRP-like cAMP-binding protein